MIAPAIFFPNAAGLVVQRLPPLLAAHPEEFASGVVVATVIPQNRPARLVTVRRDGGARRGLVLEDARLGINVWGQSDDEVGALTALVRALLPTLVDGEPFQRIEELSGPADVSALSGQARRYFTVEAVTRGEQLL